jgi:hypothetical protein
MNQNGYYSFGPSSQQQQPMCQLLSHPTHARRILCSHMPVPCLIDREPPLPHPRVCHRLDPHASSCRAPCTVWTPLLPSTVCQGPIAPHLHSSPLCLAQGVAPTLRFPQHMTCCTPPKHLVDDGIDTTPPSSVRSIRGAIQRQLWPGTRAFPPTVVATTVHSLVPLSVSAKGLHSLRALQLAGAHRQRLGPPGHLRRVRTPLATAVLAATVDAAAR